MPLPYPVRAQRSAKRALDVHHRSAQCRDETDPLVPEQLVIEMRAPALARDVREIESLRRIREIHQRQ